MAKALTKQQRDPHANLVQVRDRVRQCGYSRRKAAAICNQLEDNQCDAVLGAKDDKAVLSALKSVKLPAEKEGDESKDVPSPDKAEAERYERERNELDEAIEKRYGRKEEPESVSAK